jgi:hypothetical protein
MDVDAVGSAAAPQAQAEQPSKAPPPPGGAAGDAEWWLSDGEEPDSDGGAEAAGPAGACAAHRRAAAASALPHARPLCAGDGDELYGEELDDKARERWRERTRRSR